MLVLEGGMLLAVLEVRRPTRIDYPTLLDDPDFPLLSYPLESVIAEKADTMMFLGDANTRDRDYSDIYLLCAAPQ